MGYSITQIYFDMLNNPARSQWFKNALIEAWTEDPERAIREAKDLVGMLEAKREQIKSQKGDTKPC